MHRNAPLTPKGRLRLCLMIDEGWTIASSAESMRISRPLSRSVQGNRRLLAVSASNGATGRQGSVPVSIAGVSSMRSGVSILGTEPAVGCGIRLRR